MDLKLIGLNIKSCRNRMKLTQAQLAENINISTNHISHIENGTSKMSIDTLIDICNALNASPNEILWGTYKNPNNNISTSDNSPKKGKVTYAAPSGTEEFRDSNDISRTLFHNAENMSEEYKKLLIEISNIMVNK